MTIKEQVIKSQKRQIELSRMLAKVGYDSKIGQTLRLRFYYQDAFLLLRKFKSFLYTAKELFGDKFFGGDQAIIHTSHAEVKKLMQVEPQLRGNDLGIIRMLAPSYLLNNPLSLGMNGTQHTGARALFLQALTNPAEDIENLSNLVNQCLSEAAQKKELHIGKDLPRMMLKILHQVVFQISLSEEEVTASTGYNKKLFLATLPNFINKYTLGLLTAPSVKHRKQLTQRYKQSPLWSSYVETGAKYNLNEHQIANSLFDMIHIAGTLGTSALLGSTIGVLCLDEALRNNVISEVNTVWNEQETPNPDALKNSILINKVILETARLYPAVRFVSQLAQEGGEIEIGESKCPFQKGTRLIGSIFTANRDAARYENPDSFDSERDFSDILSWNGHGHERACPGRDLSIGLINIFVLYLFKKYKWDSITEVKWEFEKVTAVTPNELVLQGFAKR
ncbi:cytochrome P450 [Rivularia sp. PCC 7116]|uniref:cytochrome P450 n=1 Tax=Rivularia sp. PCC 7116 TaxID=373994 RepID=UPI00029F44A4|nr:cytochrome P450 [Rivularia sp. PCC 7116]AFY58434.1 cytochrome P450 [Rivularia sp. PCC 7116]